MTSPPHSICCHGPADTTSAVRRNTAVRPAEAQPRSAAGVQAGDVITRLAIQPVATVEEFLGALRDIDPGRQVTVAITRDGTERTATLTAAEHPGRRKLRPPCFKRLFPSVRPGAAQHNDRVRVLARFPKADQHSMSGLIAGLRHTP